MQEPRSGTPFLVAPKRGGEEEGGIDAVKELGRGKKKADNNKRGERISQSLQRGGDQTTHPIVFKTPGGGEKKQRKLGRAASIKKVYKLRRSFNDSMTNEMEKESVYIPSGVVQKKKKTTTGLIRRAGSQKDTHL